MPDDPVLLLDASQAAERIARFIADMTRSDFLGDEKTQSAVVREITVMGEAAIQVSDAFRTSRPEVPWRRLTNFRHFYIHAYRRLDYEEVWRAATRLVPQAHRMIAPLTPSEPGESE